MDFAWDQEAEDTPTKHTTAHLRKSQTLTQAHVLTQLSSYDNTIQHNDTGLERDGGREPPSRWQLLKASWQAGHWEQLSALHSGQLSSSLQQGARESRNPSGPRARLDDAAPAPPHPSASPGHQGSPGRWRPVAGSPAEKLAVYQSQLESLDASLPHAARQRRRGVDQGAPALRASMPAGLHTTSTHLAPRHSAADVSASAGQAALLSGYAYPHSVTGTLPSDSDTLQETTDSVLARVSALQSLADHRPTHTLLPASDPLYSQPQPHPLPTLPYSTTLPASQQAGQHSTDMDATIAGYGDMSELNDADTISVARLIIENAQMHLMALEFEQRQEQLTQPAQAAGSTLQGSHAAAAVAPEASNSGEVGQGREDGGRDAEEAAQLVRRGRMRRVLREWRHVVAVLRAHEQLQATRALQYRCARLMRAWRKVAVAGRPERQAYAAETAWEAKAHQVADRYRSLRLMYSALTAWRQGALAGRQERRAVEEAERARQAEEQVLLSWQGVVETSHYERAQQREAAIRQAHITAFLQRLQSGNVAPRQPTARSSSAQTRVSADQPPARAVVGTGTGSVQTSLNSTAVPSAGKGTQGLAATQLPLSDPARRARAAQAMGARAAGGAVNALAQQSAAAEAARARYGGVGGGSTHRGLPRADQVPTTHSILRRSTPTTLPSSTAARATPALTTSQTPPVPVPPVPAAIGHTAKDTRTAQAQGATSEVGVLSTELPHTPMVHGVQCAGVLLPGQRSEQGQRVWGPRALQQAAADRARQVRAASGTPPPPQPLVTHTPSHHPTSNTNTTVDSTQVGEGWMGRSTAVQGSGEVAAESVMGGEGVPASRAALLQLAAKLRRRATQSAATAAAAGAAADPSLYVSEQGTCVSAADGGVPAAEGWQQAVQPPAGTLSGCTAAPTVATGAPDGTLHQGDTPVPATAPHLTSSSQDQQSHHDNDTCHAGGSYEHSYEPVSAEDSLTNTLRYNEGDAVTQHGRSHGSVCGSVGGTVSAEDSLDSTAAPGGDNNRPGSTTTLVPGAAGAPGRRAGCAQTAPVAHAGVRTTQPASPPGLVPRHTHDGVGDRMGVRGRVGGKGGQGWSLAERGEAGDADALRLLQQARAAAWRRQRSTAELLDSLSAQLMSEATQLAELHYQRALLLRCGLRPWQRLMAERHARTLHATCHHAAVLLQKSWAAWRMRVRQSTWRRASCQAASIARLRHAHQVRCASQALCAWRMWLMSCTMARHRLCATAIAALCTYVRWARLARRDAALHCRDRTQRRALRGWLIVATDMSRERLEEELRLMDCVEDRVRAMRLRRVLRAWRAAATAARADAEAAARRAATWQKIHTWLDELKTTDTGHTTTTSNNPYTGTRNSNSGNHTDHPHVQRTHAGGVSGTVVDVSATAASSNMSEQLGGEQLTFLGNRQWRLQVGALPSLGAGHGAVDRTAEGTLLPTCPHVHNRPQETQGPQATAWAHTDHHHIGDTTEWLQGAGAQSVDQQQQPGSRLQAEWSAPCLTSSRAEGRGLGVVSGVDQGGGLPHGAARVGGISLPGTAPATHSMPRAAGSGTASAEIGSNPAEGSALTEGAAAETVGDAAGRKERFLAWHRSRKAQQGHMAQ